MRTGGLGLLLGAVLLLGLFGPGCASAGRGSVPGSSAAAPPPSPADTAPRTAPGKAGPAGPAAPPAAPSPARPEGGPGPVASLPPGTPPSPPRAEVPAVVRESPWLRTALGSLSRPALPGGASLLVKQDPDRRLAACELCIVGAAGLSLPGKEGALALGLALLARGSAEAPPGSLSRALEDAGARLELKEISYDALGLELVAPPEALPGLLESLVQALASPAFLSEGFPKADWDQAMRDLRVRALKDSRDPSLIAASRLRAEVYAGHPYAAPPLGTPESLLGLSRADVAAAWKSLGSERIRIAAVGPLDPSALAARLSPALSRLGSSGPRPIPAPPLPLRNSLILVPETWATGAYLRLDAGAPSASAADYAAYLLGLAILQDLLEDELRGDIPLAYGVGTRLSSAAAPSSSVLVTRARGAEAAKAGVERAIRLAASGACISPVDGHLAKLEEALGAYRLRVLTRTYATASRASEVALRMARDLASGGDGSAWFRLADRLASVGAPEVLQALRARLVDGPRAWCIVAPPDDLAALKAAP